MLSRFWELFVFCSCFIDIEDETAWIEQQIYYHFKKVFMSSKFLLWSFIHKSKTLNHNDIKKLWRLIKLHCRQTTKCIRKSVLQNLSTKERNDTEKMSTVCFKGKPPYNKQSEILLNNWKKYILYLYCTAKSVHHSGLCHRITVSFLWCLDKLYDPH